MYAGFGCLRNHVFCIASRTSEPTAGECSSASGWQVRILAMRSTILSGEIVLIVPRLSGYFLTKS